MTGRLSTLLLNAWVDVECPLCDFPFDVQMVDVVSQVWRWCPCCRARIRLVDDHGGTSTGLADADAAMRDFERMLGEMLK